MDPPRWEEEERYGSWSHGDWWQPDDSWSDDAWQLHGSSTAGAMPSEPSAKHQKVAKPIVGGSWQHQGSWRHGCWPEDNSVKCRGVAKPIAKAGAPTSKASDPMPATIPETETVAELKECLKDQLPHYRGVSRGVAVQACLVSLL